MEMRSCIGLVGSTHPIAEALITCATRAGRVRCGADGADHSRMAVWLVEAHGALPLHRAGHGNTG
jgi:hypothetical protein